ncbi:UNVERIFIED_CONTAM: Ubiquinol oxidase 1, mitochondrial [Sesamum calycinum]|uniref:Ubiquinol oxidase n=1 Tax=Sesamum calycinum TaxID=2727403 RepID=A0AAW2LY16_9LAMI
MMSRSATRVARSVLTHVGPRYFSTVVSRGGAASDVAALGGYVHGGAATFVHGPAKGPEKVVVTWMRVPVLGSRNASTLALGEKQQEEEKKKVQAGSDGGAAAGGGGNGNKAIVSYWGVEPAKVTKEDGSEWRWNCFKPWETYKADLSIDLKKHHAPVTFLDKVAYWTVKALRFPTDLFFQRRYGCRAMMLETVAAVPGMVGGMLLHCKSLRRFEHSGGWIKALLEEAENERMHLMTFMELAHRIVGYLEEEAIHSYTEFLKELDKGTIENVPAPAIAVDYWRLPKNSTLRDVVMVVRADEAHHRDVNHFASDIHYQGHELKEAPAPIGYH